ncbi:hypothetical protein M406DRAFT_333657 [Cryphonectria parasitica EP155]|uniref:Uncharacterized protein n=1 Tax=Cryphonectria parasitica (strain ATCC 38755 / EP155) TaxID=660469 RepID=A0A9P5CK20_CRYP1|nr:uncharacterized protein M406DRAFT_333657 [Cryphonectria parasitica EP155]KAF3761598.1 hypothetical protein M406DRAFT_333657 [Cryphonectria parasitica EP155]
MARANSTDIVPWLQQHSLRMEIIPGVVVIKGIFQGYLCTFFDTINSSISKTTIIRETSSLGPSPDNDLVSNYIARVRLKDLATATVSSSPFSCSYFFADTPTVTRTEKWKRRKRIGAGGFLTVWLESCIEGQENKTDTQRAVKVLQLPSGAPSPRAIAQCGHELNTFAKFSQRKSSSPQLIFSSDSQ